MTTITRRRFIGAVAAAALTAPAVWLLLEGAPAEAGPPEIRYGRDRCDACGMLISDPRYAAAARRPDAALRYDDIACLVRGAGAAIAAEVAAGWVHDAATESWVEARQAAYVRSPAIRTPMSSGLVAYATPARARAAHPGATVLTFAALVGTPAEPRG
jgi:copper chaperone NosL